MTLGEQKAALPEKRKQAAVQAAQVEELKSALPEDVAQMAMALGELLAKLAEQYSVLAPEDSERGTYCSYVSAYIYCTMINFLDSHNALHIFFSGTYFVNGMVRHHSLQK